MGAEAPDDEDEALAALRDRLVGQRYRNTDIEESFTVVGVDDVFLLIQYDDGVAWDEIHGPGRMAEDDAERFGVSADGIADEKYEPLGPGPRLDRACARNGHTFSPMPSAIWPGGVPEGVTRPEQVYSRLARCTKCGLSPEVLAAYAEQVPVGPTFCGNCSAYDYAPLDYCGFEAVGDWILCPECQEGWEAEPAGE